MADLVWMMGFEPRFFTGRRKYSVQDMLEVAAYVFGRIGDRHNHKTLGGINLVFRAVFRGNRGNRVRRIGHSISGTPAH
jgi:hypothetical protein